MAKENAENSVYTYIGRAISFLYPANAVVIRKTEQRLRDGIRLYRKGGRQKTSAEQTLKQQIALKITRGKTTDVVLNCTSLL